MAISRRRFLKAATGGGALLIASRVPEAGATMSRELPPHAVGILYDATLCIGCKSCMASCKKENSVPGGALYKKGMEHPPYENAQPGEAMWDAPRELTGKTLNIIKVYKNGSGQVKDREKDGYAFFKQQCLHCISPACASVCPAGAFRKDADSGAVIYIASRCIGCRYCQLACPFGVPRYEWDSAWPEVRKCQLCEHRIKEGKYSACAETCPTGATIFGKVVDLRAEGKRRLALKPGEPYLYPLQKVDAKEKTLRPASHYVNQLYGLIEAGGTQNMMLSGVSFDRLGFRSNVAHFDLPSLTWAYIAKIPWVFLGVFLGGTAIYKVTHRAERGDKS